MQYPDLVWTTLGIIGGFLLIKDTDLTPRGKWGVGLIFIGFLFQVFWEITHPWGNNSLAQVIFVIVYLAIVFPLLVWPGLLWKWMTKTKNLK